jgi:hypothetical protein
VFAAYLNAASGGVAGPQVSLANTLVQWPYLADLGLISAIINVFYSDWGAAPKLPPAWLQLRRNPWLYFNLVIKDSQVGCCMWRSLQQCRCLCLAGILHCEEYLA